MDKIARDTLFNTPGKNKTLTYLTKELILEHSHDIFAEFFGIFKYNKNYASPLRCDDKHASFRIYSHRNGLAWFKDYGGRHGNAIDFVMEIRMVGFYEAMVIINNRLSLGYEYNKGSINAELNYITPRSEKIVVPEDTGREVFEINILSNKDIYGNFTYTYTDMNYWASMFIESTRLLRHQLVSVDKAYRNGNLIAEYSNTNPVYAYLFKHADKWYTKLYRPFEKESWKFYSDLIDKSDIMLYGLPLLPDKVDKLILTKSGKDVMVCERCEHWSIGLQGEDIYPSDEILYSLSKKANELLIFMDNDWNKKINVGKELAIKFESHIIQVLGSDIRKKLKRIHVPDVYKCTDISDVAYKYRDYYGTKNLLNSLVHGYI